MGKFLVDEVILKCKYEGKATEIAKITLKIIKWKESVYWYQDLFYNYRNQYGTGGGIEIQITEI